MCAKSLLMAAKLIRARPVFLGDPNFELLNRSQVLKIRSPRLGEQGHYHCDVTNVAGKQSKDFKLNVYGESLWSPWV